MPYYLTIYDDFPIDTHRAQRKGAQLLLLNGKWSGVSCYDKQGIWIDGARALCLAVRHRNVLSWMSEGDPQ